MTSRILLIEDEPGLSLTIADRLSNEGYLVETAEDGETGLASALKSPYDLLIVDWMLPRRSGLDVVKKLRASDVASPVLMLTARSQVVDKVVGLQSGADDYLTKPFDMMELLARVEALLRRSRPAPELNRYQFGEVVMDFRQAEVTRRGEPVPLTAKEFQLAKYLIEHRGETLSRDELLHKVWGYDVVPNTRTVDVHMNWLRQKLEENPQFPQFFLTLRGLGYKFAG